MKSGDVSSPAISPGGGIIEGRIIYEPLTPGEVGWFVVWDPTTTEYGPKIVKAKPADKDSAAHLDFAGERYYFSGPLVEPFWRAPHMRLVAQWASGNYKPISSKQVYLLLKRYFEHFGDFQDDYASVILTLFAVQSHIKPVLDVLFQLPISGPFGSGKTAELQALADVSYHSFLEASASPPTRARVIAHASPTYFSDELDKTTTQGGEDDNAALVILRVGYRRGVRYLRWDSDANTWVSIEIFFPLAYTFSSDVEQAFKQRGLSEVAVMKSADPKLPIVNTARSRFAVPIADALFFWRMQFLSKAIRDGRLATTEGLESKGMSTTLEQIMNMDKAEFRATVYNDLVKGFSSRDRYLLERLFGREAELAYVALNVEKALDVDVIDDLAAAVNRQRQALAAEPDSRFSEFRKQIITTARGLIIKTTLEKPPEVLKNVDSADPVTAFFKIDKQFVKVELTGVLDATRAYAKEHKLNEKLGPKTLGTWYRKLGVVAGKNKLHEVAGDYLKVDAKTWQTLNASAAAEEVDLSHLPAKPKEADSIDSTDSIGVFPGATQGSQEPSGKSSIESIASIESAPQISNWEGGGLGARRTQQDLSRPSTGRLKLPVVYVV